MRSIPLAEVIARWGYSEVVNAKSSTEYDSMLEVDAIREKRLRNVPFEALSPTEIVNLYSACYNIRPNLFYLFQNIDQFKILDINRSWLGNVLVPPNVWQPDSQGRFVKYKDYITTPTDDKNDSRYMLLDKDIYEKPRDLITFGRHNGELILIDGFHRVVRFWRSGNPDDLIFAYVPK
jgi:hypothetical protein